MATEQLPLNKFRLLTKSLNSGSNLIYSQSLSVSTIVLSAQVTNITGSIQLVDVYVVKSGSVSRATVLHSGSIPPNESLNPFAGKLVLEQYDSLYIQTAHSGSLETVLSVLENANN
jgi:hypothetical protein